MEVQYFAAEISTVNPQIPTANPKWPAPSLPPLESLLRSFAYFTPVFVRSNAPAKKYLPCAKSLRKSRSAISFSRSRWVAATRRTFTFRVGAAQALDFPLLQSPQQLRLDFNRNVPNFVQK
jgi:hypothetical protein